MQRLILPPGVVLVAVLDSLHPFLHLQSNRPSLNVVLETTVDKTALPANLAHRADNCSRASTKDLHHAALIGRISNVLHCELLLEDVPALWLQTLACKAQDRVSRDTLENGAVKRRGEQLWLAGLFVLDRGKQVHGADLRDVLLLAEQPQGPV